MVKFDAYQQRDVDTLLKFVDLLYHNHKFID